MFPEYGALGRDINWNLLVALPKLSFLLSSLSAILPSRPNKENMNLLLSSLSPAAYGNQLLSHQSAAYILFSLYSPSRPYPTQVILFVFTSDGFSFLFLLVLPAYHTQINLPEITL